MQLAWAPDFLGRGVEYASLGRGLHGELGTLIRFGPDGTAHDAEPDATHGQPSGALLYVHGWSDYFFNLELAHFAVARGFTFYALDLPEHGRSLAAGEMPGFVGSADHYLESVGAAVDTVRREAGHAPILMGHSTGGLAAALYAQRSASDLRAVVLSSPWLVPHGGPTAGRLLEAALRPASLRWPRGRLPLPSRGYFWRAVAKEAGGEWELREDLRPRNAFPVRVGWLHGVLEGQRMLRAGPRLELPVLLLASTTSDLGLVWREHMRERDAVLSIAPMRRAAADLCVNLDEALVERGLHDVLLSPTPVRNEAYGRLGRWLDELGADRS
ncbi:alpha/beta hydrolase [Sinomonas notoginsengisoli]|uniref:alpha/beta fold hydrolase n=1 Tax=Sinomonas notoginsengisoli TaxID=1457311 RepID=UPI001F1C86CE|nr:alpha/beta fold hydrolase [Sinomonas notoginsengisoli]